MKKIFVIKFETNLLLYKTAFRNRKALYNAYDNPASYIYIYYTIYNIYFTENMEYNDFNVKYSAQIFHFHTYFVQSPLISIPRNILFIWNPNFGFLDDFADFRHG